LDYSEFKCKWIDPISLSFFLPRVRIGILQTVSAKFRFQI